MILGLYIILANGHKQLRLLTLERTREKSDCKCPGPKQAVNIG